MSIKHKQSSQSFTSSSKYSGLKMASNESNGHISFDPNIKIKPEPGSEPSVLLTTVKTEPGLPHASESGIPSSSGRLPTFKPPRDWTLGGGIIKQEKARKVFVPNLNVQRLKDKVGQNPVKNEPVVTPRPNKRNKDRERPPREKNREGNSNLVQSSGIFSEGVSNSTSQRRSNYGYDRESGERNSAQPLQRPKLSVPSKLDKSAEAEKIKELLRDDFIDDNKEVDSTNEPLTLPMNKEAKIFGKSENEFSSVIQNGSAKIKEFKEPMTVTQVLESKSSNFVLIQLPDCLPGFPAEDPKDDPKNKSNGSAETALSGSRYTKLNDLKEGLMGKLQIYRSGKAKLVLGDNDLVIDVGSTVSFRQDVTALKINPDKKSGDLINLGIVSNTLVCSPDWETMLSKM